MECEFPLWFSLLVLDAEYWPLTVPIALGLAVLGWFGSKWLARIAFTVAVVVALPPAVYATNLAVDRLVYQRTIYRDQTVAGVPLYAGSKIRFWNHEQTVIDWIELPRVTDISGIPFTGTVWRSGGEDGPVRWDGTLAADQSIDGWPCSSGAVEINGEGGLRRCELATPHAFFDYELPAGTTVNYNPANSTWSWFLPEDNGIALKVLFANAPGGINLQVTNDGRLTGIVSRIDKTVMVRGAPLSTMNINLSGDAVLGQLAQPFEIAGKQQPAGTPVRIDLVAGNVSLAAPK